MVMWCRVWTSGPVPHILQAGGPLLGPKFISRRMKTWLEVIPFHALKESKPLHTDAPNQV
jgi:hypothetical protein